MIRTEWFVQVWAADGKTAKSEVRFAAFAPLHAYVVAFKAEKTTDILMVHLPADATNDERRRIKALGAVML